MPTQEAAGLADADLNTQGGTQLEGRGYNRVFGNTLYEGTTGVLLKTLIKV